MSERCGHAVKRCPKCAELAERALREERERAVRALKLASSVSVILLEIREALGVEDGADLLEAARRVGARTP